MKKLNYFINICMGAFMGVFVGHCIYKTMHYYSHPELYRVYSAPWYTSIHVYGLVTLLVVVSGLAIKYFIKKKTDSKK